MDSETSSMTKAIDDESLSNGNSSNKKKRRNKGQAKFSRHRHPNKKIKGSILIARSNRYDKNGFVKCKAKNEFFFARL